MYDNSLFYALLLLIAAGVSLITASLLWPRRRVRSVVPLIVFFLSLFVWSLTYAFYWLADSTAVRLFWLDATFFGVVTAPAAVFVFMLMYTNRGHWVNQTTLAFLAVEPILTLVLLWTDPLHGVFLGGKRTPDTAAILEGGPWFWLNVVYSYTLLLITYILLIQFYRKSTGPYRTQTGIMLFAFALPWLTNIFSLSDLNPVPDIDLTALAFTVAGLIIVYALFYTELFDLMPVARDKIMERMREPVFVVDKQQRIVDVNLASRRLIRETHPQFGADLVGQPVTDFFPAWLEWVHSSDERPAVAFDIGGVPRYYERLFSSLTDHQGKHLGSVMLLHDITRRQQVQQREIELTLEKERIQLLATFIQAAAHEFRTPLTVINSSAYLMARIDDPARRALKAQQVSHYVNHVARLVDMMITTVDLESKESLNRTPIDLTIILKIACQSVKNRHENGPELHYTVPSTLPAIIGDAYYLNLAFSHILDNAFVFSPADSMVSVAAGIENASIWVKICDTGPGLEESALANIFKTFWRKDEMHSTPGFGLGLAIMRRVIELHQGTVQVTSQPGQGMCFYVMLPAVMPVTTPDEIDGPA